MTPTFTSCADAACVMANAAATAVAATAAIVRLDIKNPPRFPEISVDFSVRRKPEMAQAKSGCDGAGLRRATPAHYSSYTATRIQEDISMTAWTRIGIAAI